MAVRRGAALAAMAFALALVAVALIGSHGTDPSPELPSERPTLADTIPAGPDPVAAPGEISVLTLVGEMADLGHLARLPDAPFVAGQAASTDRQSRWPGEGDKWFANDDFVTATQENLVRVENPDGGDARRYVLLDARGPGALVRLWTATPAGTLRIYIDDNPRPVVEAPFRELLIGEVAPFLVPLAHLTARGYNLYFPFPYRQHCVVTVDSIVSPDPFTEREMGKLYFQIGYRTYGPDQASNVRAYSAAEVERASRAIWRATVALRDGPSADAPPPAPGGRRIALAPVTTIDAPAGGGRITDLRISIPESARADARDTEIAIAFDGEETVRAPLPFFFGSGPNLTSYATLPLAMTFEGTLICRFPMPFQRRATITLSRRDGRPVSVDGTAIVDPAPFDDRTLLFHAGHHPLAAFRTRPFFDWRLGTIAGTGRLVGTMLTVVNPADAPWWGEGDEKIYVDGATFPSLFGTGTEDYFGYAWSTPDRFAHAYHAQTEAPVHAFAGRFTMNRFHVLDPIPFTRKLKFDFEIWHWADTNITAEAMLYWYARPGGSNDLSTPPEPANAAPPQTPDGGTQSDGAAAAR